jgi:hypothetical protein
MDNAHNCDSYVSMSLSQTYRSLPYILFKVEAVRVAPDLCYRDMMHYGVIYSSMSTNYKKHTLRYVISSSCCIHELGRELRLC